MTMLHMRELPGRELKWMQPNGFKMEYELHADEILAATLRFRSSFGTLATAESADGCWTFKRVGFWQPQVTVRVCNTETNLAVFKNNTWSGGGTLELPDGRKYPASTNFWSTKYEFKTETGTELLSYQQIGGFLRMSSAVIIHPAAAQLAEAAWLVPLGWYLTVMMHMDSAATAAAVSAAT
jgi:hypothetical protein